jgi:hypothetical protein
MAHSEPVVTNRLGPFVVGSTSSDLTNLVNKGELGLRILDREEQSRDYYKARCESLESVAREFFFNYEGCSHFILQKTRETAKLPGFTEYVYCWLIDDQLSGAILSGVTSDAGTHAQVNEQEAELWEHASEVAEALSLKYPESTESFVNFFNFEIYPAPPDLHGMATAGLFTSFERLVTATEEDDSNTRLQTQFCGPAIVELSRKKHDGEIPTGATHSSQSSRKCFSSPECHVIYDFKIERYVRTIESIHVYESLIYLSRGLKDDLGRQLNARQSAQLHDQAQAEIARWRNSIQQAEAAKKTRVLRLAEIL